MQGLKDLMSGGSCNPSLTTNSGNAFRNFMNMTGSTHQQVGLQTSISADQNLGSVLQNFSLAWEKEQEVYRIQEVQRQAILQKIWAEENMKQQALAQELAVRSAVAERAWMKSENSLVNNHWHATLVNPVSFSMPIISENISLAAKEASLQQEDLNQKQTSNPMLTTHLIETMMSDSDPKFQESEFLNFMKQIQNGEVEIKDNVVINRSEKAKVDESAFNDNIEVGDGLIEYAIKENQIASEKGLMEVKDEKDLENQNEMQGGKRIEDYWEDLIKTYDENNEENIEKLHKLWELSIKEYEAAAAERTKTEQWQKSHEMDTNKFQNEAKIYNFEESNPYSLLENPLDSLKETLQKGNSFNTRLVLEAHLQKNKNDFKGWRSLGLLLQELNEDQASVSCFLNALEICPTDKSTLLQLGVACNNVFDELHAIMYLEKWLDAPGLSFISQSEIKDKKWTGNEIMLVKKSIQEKFLAFQKKDDPEWLYAFAVINYICQDFDEAKTLFKQAVEIDPNNYFLWNKLGAAHAKSKNLEETQAAYHQALNLKPNYLRSWINLAINYNSKKMYEQAASFILNSLALNPKSVNLWTNLENAFIMSGDHDALGEVYDRDISKFATKHNIHNFDDLPPPDGLDYLSLFSRYLLRDDLDSWIASFSGKKLDDSVTLD